MDEPRNSPENENDTRSNSEYGPIDAPDTDASRSESPQAETPHPDARRDRGGDRAGMPQSFKRRHWGKLLLLTLAMLPIVAFTVWSVVTLNWSYSEGVRPGYVQKISKKGFVCKTWEGILYTDLKGFRSDSFQFSVRSDSIAKLLQTLSGKQVSLDYQQHIGVPSSCFGDSEYFVTGVRELKQ